MNKNHHILLKTDSNRLMEWNRKIGYYYTEDILSMIQINDGGFVIAGGVKPYDASQDILIAKFTLTQNWQPQSNTANFESISVILALSVLIIYGTHRTKKKS